MAQVEDLVGEYCTDVRMNADQTEITFTLSNGREFVMNHAQDCCEHVYVESIVGDLTDLINSPILRAEEVSFECGEIPDEVSATAPTDESFTWTFYKFVTFKGYVDIRWFGGSNGYYSESVNFTEVTKCLE